MDPSTGELVVLELSLFQSSFIFIFHVPLFLYGLVSDGLCGHIQLNLCVFNWF